ncbi:MAG: methyltransferase domain-containing protein [Sedimentisphaerales bacterium]
MTFEEKIKQRYTGSQGREYHEGKRSIPDTAYHWVAKLRAEKISSHIGRNDVVFEYGVGSGWNLAELNCEKKLGYDLSEHLAETVRLHGIEFVKDVGSVADSSADALVCHHVLEHMANPVEFFGDARRILRNKGKLLLFVPYEKEKRYRYYNPNEPNHHLYSWNVQTLGNLVTDMGFEIELPAGRNDKAGIRKFGYDRFSSVWAVKLHLGESGFRLIRRAIHIIKPAYEICIIAMKE